MIKTRTGAQRYNARMDRLFDKAMRLKKEAVVVFNLNTRLGVKNWQAVRQLAEVCV